MDIELQSSAPAGKNIHMAVYVTDIVVNISSSSIRTITATLASLSSKDVSRVSRFFFSLWPEWVMLIYKWI